MANLDGYNSTRDVNAQSFYNKKPEDYSELDLDSMWSFNEQYINIEKVNGKDDLYLTVFSFDHQDKVKYEITITESSSAVCPPCANN